MTVYLVGAGPGDPGLLTRRGAELLERADVVVYDRLASPTLLGLVPAGAELVDVGKAPGRVAMQQEQINELLVARGAAGLEVVRLKGGDPFVFGRGGEEAEACRDAGVPFEVVPGVTSAIAAPAYAGIPVTHRGLSTSVTVVTGHEDPTKPGTDTDWAALARRRNARRVDGSRAPPRHHAGPARRRPRALDAGRRRAVGNATGAAHRARNARDDRRARRRVAECDRDRCGGGARSRVVRATPVVRSAGGGHPSRVSRRASCGSGSSSSVPR